MLREVGDHIWQIQGLEPGPHVIICGGMHGDELIGIEVVKKLKEVFTRGEKRLISGKLTLILANVEAIKMGTRSTSPERELNDLFSKKYLSAPPEDYYESCRAHEIAPFLREADVLLDLHAASLPTEPFLPCLFDERHEKVFRWFDTDIVLADPWRVLYDNDSASMDMLVDESGGVGVCLEGGLASDVSRVPAVFSGVMNILADQGLVESVAPLVLPRKKYRIFELIKEIKLTEAGFRFADDFKKPRSFMPVRAGQIIGYAGNELVKAEEDGVIVFPKAESQWVVGQDVVFLAKKKM